MRVVGAGLLWMLLCWAVVLTTLGPLVVAGLLVCRAKWSWSTSPYSEEVVVGGLLSCRAPVVLTARMLQGLVCWLLILPKLPIGHCLDLLR